MNLMRIINDIKQIFDYISLRDPLNLLENYARNKNTTAEVVYDEWEKRGIIQYIYDMYERYHQEALENAYEDMQ